MNRLQSKLKGPRRYVLDTNVFITAWCDTYPMDLYPGFWKCLEHFAEQGILLSINQVRSEIKYPDGLVAWVDQSWNKSFVSTKTTKVGHTHSKLQYWVEDNDQFQDRAKIKFTKIADGWLAAYALANCCVLATNEVPKLDVKKRVPLPNLCSVFNIEYCDTVDMLRGLGVKFDMRPLDSSSQR